MKTQQQTDMQRSNQIKLKAAVLSFLFLFTFLFTNAQDNIILRDGSEISAKVLEISDVEVRYKSGDNLTGPIRILSKSEIFMIKYENGSKTTMENNAGAPAVTMPPAVAKPVANISDTGDYVPKRVTKFGGPRIGLTMIGAGEIASELADRGKNPFLTQFGWQFEQRLFSIDNGPAGLIEFVPLIGGMEQGLFLPSASLLIGLRGAGANSIEFAMGPNVSISGVGMVFACGINFHTDNINFPVNIAYVPSVGRKEYIDETNVTVNTGHRISLLVGFNVRKH